MGVVSMTAFPNVLISRLNSQAHQTPSIMVKEYKIVVICTYSRQRAVTSFKYNRNTEVRVKILDARFL